MVYSRWMIFEWENTVSWNYYSFIPLLAMVLLLPFNYYFEWMKWSIVLRKVTSVSTQKTKIHSFFAGIITGMLTPNMQGNFLGRIYYFPRNERIKITILTLWGNFVQFVVALFLGVLSMWLIGSDSYVKIPFGLKVLISSLVLFLFVMLLFAPQIVGIFKKSRSVQRLRTVLLLDRTFTFELFFWGAMRYFVFSLQFLLVIHAFGADFSLINFLLIWQVYLWTTIAPSLFLGKLVVRETIAIWVLASLGIGVLNIVLASLLVWIVNLLVPTLIALLICKRKEA